jgi:deoxyribose-phosphate aldolase
VAEVEAAVTGGADEVDIVAPLGAIMEGDVGLVGELVEAARDAAGAGIVLKLILETGVLQEPQRITAAARAAVMAGIDFLKTSTGKTPVSATLEAATLLLEVIEEAGGRIGFKAAGGIRTANDAVGYLLLADELLGPGWATPERFRFGASALLDELEGQVRSGSGY